MPESLHNDEKPPFFKSWNTLYGIVLLFHVLMISLFSWITSMFV